MYDSAIIKRITGDIKLLGLSFLVLFLILKIVFFNEPFLGVLASLAALYWILVLPAFGITYLIEDTDFIERFVISIPLSAALVGIFSYYAGLAGISAKGWTFLIPLLLIAISAAIIYLRSRDTEKSKTE